MYSLLINKCRQWNIELSDEQVKSFNTYYELLTEWNKKLNLTAITEFDEVIVKHFLDSLLLADVIDINNISNLIDVGTGAGFPGIPLKIAFPHLKLTLLDSLNKRVVFLDEVIKRLGLNDVVTVHGRAENVSREINFRESFDLCVSRAVANLSTLTELCTPFVKVGGRFISYKSGNCDDEVLTADNAVSLLGCVVAGVEKRELFDSSRSFVIIDRAEHVKEKYPRREGIPGKKPL